MQKIKIQIYLTPSNYILMAKYMQQEHNNSIKNEGQAINHIIEDYFAQEGRLQRLIQKLEGELQDANLEIDRLKGLYKKKVN